MDQDQINPAAKRIAETIIARAQILAMGTPSIPKERVIEQSESGAPPAAPLQAARQAVAEAERRLQAARNGAARARRSVERARDDLRYAKAAYAIEAYTIARAHGQVAQEASRRGTKGGAA